MVSSYVGWVEERNPTLSVNCWVSLRSTQPTILAGMMIKGKPKKSSPGQMSLPWDKQRVSELRSVHEVAEKFI